jgi:nifR3 family TIM-barrel protein
MTRDTRAFYSTVMLAPIAGVTDRAARTIAREMGCPLAFSELISATGIAMRNRKTLAMLDICRNEHPLVIQIFGKNPLQMEEAAKLITDIGPDGIDLNLGCPAKNVVNHGSGIALTRDLALLAEIIRKVRGATSLPFSVKMRAGWNAEELTFLEVARIAQEEGVDGIILHARTRAMGFSGEAFRPWIGELKSAVNVPVVGNGDVKDGLSAARMIAETGCDGVMVGRGSYGNPWIFREIRHYLAGQESLPPVGLAERIEVLVRHIRLVVEEKGEAKGIHEMRKHVGWYLKGYPTVKEMRRVVNHLEKMDEVIIALQNWARDFPPDLTPIHAETEAVSPESHGIEDRESIEKVSDFQQVQF